MLHYLRKRVSMPSEGGVGDGKNPERGQRMCRENAHAQQLFEKAFDILKAPLRHESADHAVRDLIRVRRGHRPAHQRGASSSSVHRSPDKKNASAMDVLAAEAR
jgi:hypothetical protein